jgi:hypothetical protein
VIGSPVTHRAIPAGMMGITRKGDREMLKHKTDGDNRALPKPVALTPEQVQEVAAGAAAALPNQSNPFDSATSGMYPPAEPPVP